MSQPSYPRFAHLGSGARRAMWRELEVYTNTPEARTARERQEAELMIGHREYLENIPLLSPEPDETFGCEYPTPPPMGTSDFTVITPVFSLSRASR